MHGPQRDTFLHRRYIVIDDEACIGCSLCVKTCPLGNVIAMDGAIKKAYVYNPFMCAGCLKCVTRCPSKAIKSIELPDSADAIIPRRHAKPPGYACDEGI